MRHPLKYKGQINLNFSETAIINSSLMELHNKTRLGFLVFFLTGTENNAVVLYLTARGEWSVEEEGRKRSEPLLKANHESLHYAIQ